jgi:hypothetical protein
MRALADNIKKYESANGEIIDLEQPSNLPFTFGGPTAQA